MKTIYKYPFRLGRFEIEMPTVSTVVAVQTQPHTGPVMWAEVYTETPLKKRTFRTFGTGFEIPLIELKYIQTFQLPDGTVWHLYEEL